MTAGFLCRHREHTTSVTPTRIISSSHCPHAVRESEHSATTPLIATSVTQFFFSFLIFYYQYKLFFAPLVTHTLSQLNPLFMIWAPFKKVSFLLLLLLLFLDSLVMSCLFFNFFCYLIVCVYFVLQFITLRIYMRIVVLFKIKGLYNVEWVAINILWVYSSGYFSWKE